MDKCKQIKQKISKDLYILEDLEKQIQEMYQQPYMDMEDLNLFFDHYQKIHHELKRDLDCFEREFPILYQSFLQKFFQEDKR